MKYKRIISGTLAAVITFGSFGTLAFAESEPEYLPETEINTEVVEDGMFYLASGGTEITEAAGHGYLLKIARMGDAENAAKLRLTMLDQTASYGRDYTVRLRDAGLFEGGVSNAQSSKSMLDVILENEDAVEEYNYSDAVIDGSIDPEKEPEELTDEDKAELEEQAKAIAETLLDSETEAIKETAPEEAEAVTEDGKMSLAEAKSNATGLESDKMPMAGGNAAVNAPYLTNRQEELNEALGSAYMLISFDEGESEKYIEIIPADNGGSDGDRRALFQLAAEENAVVSEPYSGFTLDIIDDEEYVPASVEFSAAEYYPENGYVTVYIERTGDLTNVFELYIDTEDISAVKGVNYSEVHSKLQFPFGLKERHVNIPVRSEGLTSEARFKIKLSQPKGCEIGGCSEAEGVITPGDESFRVASDDSDEEELSIAAAYSTSSIELGKPMDLKNGAKDRHIDSGTSEWHNDHWELETTGSMYDQYLNWQYWRYDRNTRYDISGWQFDWELQSSQPCWAYTWIENSWPDNRGWNDWKVEDDDRWGRTTTRYFLNDKETGDIRIKLRRSGAFLARSPKLNIYSITPILRPFEVTLKGADPVKLINENGEEVYATQINEYKNKCDTVLENASDTGTGMLVTHSGENITVSLKNIDNCPIATITGIDIVAPDGTRTRIDGVKTNGRSASFELTNAFLRRYDSSVTYSGNGDKGKKGKFTIQPVLSNIEATLNVINDNRADISAKAPYLPASNSDQNTTAFRLNVGDYINIKAEVRPEYSNQFIWKGLRNEADGITYDRKGDAEYVGRSVTNASRTLNPLFAERENMRVVARVKTADIAGFDTSYGVFRYPSEVNGIYTDYIIADSGRGGFDLNKYYTLSARTKDSGKVAVWKTAFSDNLYSQQDFPFEARELKSENVVTLELRDAIDKSFVLTGTIYSEESLNSNNAEATAWYPAKNAFVVIDALHYGISDEKGALRTMPFKAADGCFVRYSLRSGGIDRYKDIKLTKDTSEDGSYSVSIGNNVLKIVDMGGPYIESVANYDNNKVYSSNIYIADDTVTWDATINYRGYDPGQGVPYLDSDGKTRYEKVESVEFIVVDPVSRTEKFKIDAKMMENDPSRWTVSTGLAKGRRDSYTDSDVLYARLTTNRVIGNGTADDPVLDKDGKIIGHNTIKPDGLQHTIYAPVNTGNIFVEEGPLETPDYSINPPLDGKEFKLPIIGSLLMNINIKDFNLSIENIPGGIRLGFGKLIKKWGNIYNGNGDATSDTGMIYGLSNFKEGIDDMADMIKDCGSENKIGAMALGLPVWSVTPFAGIYLDFKLYHMYNADNPSGLVQDKYMFSGGGAYVGISGSFRYTYYMLFAGVPVYVGGDVTLTIMAEFGAGGNNNLDYADIKKGITPLDDVSWDFTFRTTFNTNAYAGVGLCGVVGVRGGFSFTMYFIVSPNIKRTYPNFHTTGFRAEGAIKFWLDAVLFPIPIPTPINGIIYEGGYFKDLSALDLNTAGSLSAAADGTEPELKPRSGIPSEWVANESIGIASEYDKGESHELVKNVYDDSKPQLIDMGNGKLLLVYLDDDLSRNSANRTALKYSVYDIESGIWTEPQIVQNDGTADFSPNLCLAEGFVQVSWTSRPSDEEMGSAVDYARSLEIYTARFSTIDLTFDEIERLTDDNCYDSDPKAIYSHTTGDMMLFFSKSEAAGGSFASSVVPTQNNSQIMYMLYDDESDEWVRDRYFENELAEGADAQKLIEQYGGARFVSMPIEEFGVNDPVVIDFTPMSGLTVNINEKLKNELSAAGGDINALDKKSKEEIDALIGKYSTILNEHMEQIGIYAYTADADNNLDTAGDRELFIQTYSFRDHKTDKPIRVTNNNVSDAAPQLVWDYNYNLYLFWLEDGKNVKYINLSECMNGNTVREALFDNEPDWDTGTVTVRDGNNEQSAISSYKAYVDKDTILVAFPRANSDGSGTDIYVTGFSRTSGERTAEGGSWSDAQKITDGGEVNELPEMLVLPDGRLMMVNNRYKMDLGQDEYNTRDTRLVETIYNTEASLEAGDVTTDKIPVETGEEFKVSLAIRNTGIKPAEGFSYKMSLLNDGQAVDEKIETVLNDTKLTPGNEYAVSESFVLPDGVKNDLSKLKLRVEMKEKDVDGSVINELELFDGVPRYELSDVEAVQLLSRYIVTGTVTNKGSAAAREDDIIRLEFNDLYGQYTEDYVFDEISIGELGIGESKEFISFFGVDEGKNKAGWVNGVAAAFSGDGTRLSDYKDYILMLQYPYDITCSGIEDKTVTMKAGETLAPDVSYKGEEVFGGGKIVMASDDPSVVTVDDNNVITAVSEGESTIFMSVYPYGGLSMLKVKVEAADKPSRSRGGGGGSAARATESPTAAPTAAPAAEPEAATPAAEGAPAAAPFKDVTRGDWFYDAVMDAYESGLMNGVSDDMFEPGTGVTRAMFATVLYRLDGAGKAVSDKVFEDVDYDSYYGNAVSWASGNGIVEGYDDTRFGPDDPITREQMAAILYRYALYTGADAVDGVTVLEYIDSADISDYANEALYWCTREGIMDGFDDGSIRPAEGATRAQAAAMLMRLKHRGQ